MDAEISRTGEDIMKCPQCTKSPIWRCVKALEVERIRNIANVRQVIAQCSHCGARYVFRSVLTGRKWVWRIFGQVPYRRKAA
jgi:predicted RNA-binding Zn-ribbon protein involved in translation (DUF1610 family)